MTTMPAPTTVLAAIDGNEIARRVLEVATTLGRALHAPLRAVHVVHDGIEEPQETAAAARVHLQCLQGESGPALAAAMAAPDVAMLVMGARQRAAGPTPAGSVALTLLQQATKPVVIVPPTSVASASTVARALVPLDGTREAAVAVDATVRDLSAAGLEVVVLHVLDRDSVPACLDQPHHALESWEHEFVARWTDADHRMVLRRGVPQRCILEVAETEAADLVVLGWSQDLSSGRAQVIRELLTHSPVPLVLSPTVAEDEHDRARPSDRQGRRAA